MSTGERISSGSRKQREAGCDLQTRTPRRSWELSVKDRRRGGDERGRKGGKGKETEAEVGGWVHPWVRGERRVEERNESESVGGAEQIHPRA